MDTTVKIIAILYLDARILPSITKLRRDVSARSVGNLTLPWADVEETI